MDELEHYKNLLTARQAELEVDAETAEESSATVELDQSRVGRLSRMDALQSQAMAKESGRRRQIELQRIAAALRRVDTDDFGYCLRCDDAIVPARLNIDPAATLCIGCAEQAG